MIFGARRAVRQPALSRTPARRNFCGSTASPSSWWTGWAGTCYRSSPPTRPCSPRTPGGGVGERRACMPPVWLSHACMRGWGCVRVWCGVVRCGPVCMRLPITARARSFPQSGRAPRARGREGGPGGGGSVWGGVGCKRKKEALVFDTPCAPHRPLQRERVCGAMPTSREGAGRTRAALLSTHTHTRALAPSGCFFPSKKNTRLLSLSPFRPFHFRAVS